MGLRKEFLGEKCRGCPVRQEVGVAEYYASRDNRWTPSLKEALDAKLESYCRGCIQFNNRV